MSSNIDKEMKMAFSLVDVGKNNYITFEELDQICNQLNMGFTKEEI